MKLGWSLTLLMALSACSENSYCPNQTRPRGPMTNFPYPKDAIEKKIHVEDCLDEYTQRVSRGPSSDRDIVASAVAWCGTYAWAGLDQTPEDAQEENRVALSAVIRSRAFKCGTPDHRKFDGTLVPASWWQGNDD